MRHRRRHLSPHLTLASIFLLPVVASAQGNTSGDTLWRTSQSAPAWKGTLTPTVTLRLDDIAGAPLLGDVVTSASTPNGGVAVVDRKPDTVPIMVFGADAKLAYSIGQLGEGPGEYLLPVGIAFDAAGRAVVVSGALRRLSLFDAAGKLLRDISTRAASPSTRMARPFFSDNGEVYVAESVPRTGAGPAASLWTWPSERIHKLDLDGGAWSVPASEVRLLPGTERAPFGTRRFRMVLSNGSIVTVSSDRLGFAWTTSTGTIEGVARAAVPPAVLVEEVRELEAVREYTMKYFPASFRPPEYPIPSHKQLVTGAQADRTGLVWLRRSTTGVPGRPVAGVRASNGPPPPMLRYTEPPLFSVFRNDGTYLGDVRFPDSAELFAFAGTVVWAIERDTDGEQHLVRYSVSVAGGN